MSITPTIQSISAFDFILPALNEGLQISDVLSLVVVGANGAGKSRLGRWISNQFQNHLLKPVVRISAERHNNFEDVIQPMALGVAEGQLRNTTVERNQNLRPVTDFDFVLRTINAQHTHVSLQYSQAAKHSIPTAPCPKSKMDIMLDIWTRILPNIHLEVQESRLMAYTPEKQWYSPIEMSDGEKHVLYLLSSCLIAPENALIIVDEPEIHLHRAILSVLYDEIEKARTDCFFLYITHDLNFASSRTLAKKIWVKKYHNSEGKWDIVNVDAPEEFPEEVLLEVLGSRKPVLFVEGTRDSLDNRFYKLLYPEQHIIPLGSCEKVIQCTKSLREHQAYHHLNVFGLIDRDYRSADEIKALEENGLRTASVAEIENLFCVEEVIRFLAEKLNQDPDKVFSEISDFIANEFQKDLNNQIAKRVTAKTYFKIGKFECTAKDLSGIQSAIAEHVSKIDVGAYWAENETILKEVANSRNYNQILRYFNRENFVNRVHSFFGLGPKTYFQHVFRLLESKDGQEVIKVLQENYVPKF